MNALRVYNYGHLIRLSVIGLCLGLLAFGVSAQDNEWMSHETNASSVSKKLTGELFYPASKVGVMRLLDELSVEFTIDSDGDLRYRMEKLDWHGYIIFGEIGRDKKLWNLQVRTQIQTKSSDYQELLSFANEWNGKQKVPKIAMKTPSKMVLSVNYPVQFGFNPKEFEVNVFKQLNRATRAIVKQIEPMIMVNVNGKSPER